MTKPTTLWSMVASVAAVLAMASAVLAQKEASGGENLAAGFGSGYGVMKGAADWYGEIKFYEPGTAIPADFSSFKAGHYTQMVWAKTTEIGAGKAVIKQGDMKGWTIIVCNYNPAGNLIGAKPY